MDKRALHKISYGLYVVSTGLGDHINGQIANTVFQVTSEPPNITVCINKKNYTHSLIENSGVFAVAVLEQDTPMELIGEFGFKTGRDVEKFSDLQYRRGVTGAPILLAHSTAYFEAEVNGHLDVETHTLFCARIVDCGVLSEGEPLTYAYYHAVKRGRAPKSAPTFLGRSHEEKGNAEDSPQEQGKYRCNVCGYVYDPRQGDPDSGIIAGTPFDALPDVWVCPICGAGKEEFVKED